MAVAGEEALALQPVQPGGGTFSRRWRRQAERDELVDRTFHAPFAEANFRKRALGNSARANANDCSRPRDAAMSAGKGGVDPTDVSSLRIAVGHDGLDLRPLPAKERERATTKEAFAVLRHAGRAG